MRMGDWQDPIFGADVEYPLLESPRRNASIRATTDCGKRPGESNTPPFFMGGIHERFRRQVLSR
jgi:hypothetical protein